MKIYVVMHKDTHFDFEVEVFSTPEKAIEAAEKSVQDTVKHYKYFNPETDFDRELNSSMIESGWIYYCSYGDSGSVMVLTKELDKI